MKKFTQALLCTAITGLSGVAQAAFIDVAPNTAPAATPSAVAADNSYTNGDGQGTFLGPQLYFAGDSVLLDHSVVSTSTGPFRLTFTYLGKEAANTNSFLYEGIERFNTGTSALGSTWSTVYSGGLGNIDFGFSSVKSGGAFAGSVSNLGSGNLAPEFNFTIFEGGEDYMILSLDDNNQIDDNHDDMLIMVKASQIPEPGTLALLGLGLVGLGVARKRKA
ncbi:PEP-CTERM sorting domain-containing protein [Marinobacter halotolerans]|uniref:PEP-CTERM sorting domain-containing protein n=1 Tax=Marinobacter halotolerans TaxID=1569211 RepID=UPI001CD9AFE1|nr:PEP-CTERM sorting domain-containing protein [Marinobacter halotolerans]